MSAINCTNISASICALLAHVSSCPGAHRVADAKAEIGVRGAGGWQGPGSNAELLDYVACSLRHGADVHAEDHPLTE